jgi:type VII secretion protein EccE
VSARPAWPGSGRITLALLAVVPAVLAYPWRSSRDYWVLGIAVAVVILLFGWWRGLYFTTILRRRLAITGRRKPVPESSSGTKSTVLLQVGPPASDSDVLPLSLIAGYLNRYGVRADAIRITTRDSASGTETWVGLTVSAADNLEALQARSSRIPLHETAQVVARRLADHLREIGWEANLAAVEDVPRLFAPDARETWRALQQGSSDYVAAYRVNTDEAFPETLNAIRSHAAVETWTALEIAGSGDSGVHTVAVASAFRTDAEPGTAAPVPGLTPQRGNQRPALTALDPSSTQRLDGHTVAPAGLLTGLDWPIPAVGAHRAPVPEAAGHPA